MWSEDELDKLREYEQDAQDDMAIDEHKLALENFNRDELIEAIVGCSFGKDVLDYLGYY